MIKKLVKIIIVAKVCLTAIEKHRLGDTVEKEICIDTVILALEFLALSKIVKES